MPVEKCRVSVSLARPYSEKTSKPEAYSTFFKRLIGLDGLLLCQMLGLMSQSDPLEERVLRLLYKLSSKPPAAALEREADHGQA